MFPDQIVSNRRLLYLGKFCTGDALAFGYSFWYRLGGGEGLRRKMANQRYETELFQEQFAAIERADKRAAEQIGKVAERIVSNPQLNDGQLKGPLAGHFKKKAVERKYRIVFRSCQWCLAVKKEKCGDCSNRHDNGVILEEVFLRRDGYD
jgi:hypothetical protein